jgi:NAD(P)-dependent dehydrogenase (short-subunit alcohol dehydrogenase family)
MFQGSVWEKKMKSDPKYVKQILDSEVPLKKFGSPEDIGNIASFLSSSRSSFITGEIIVIDGGQIHSIM